MPFSGFACPFKRSKTACLFSATVLFALALPGDGLAKPSANPLDQNGTKTAFPNLPEASPTLLSRNHKQRRKRSRKKRSRDSDGGGEDNHKSNIKRRVRRDFEHADKNEDGKLTRAEWSRRGNFDRLDADDDAHLSFREVMAMYKDHDQISYDWPPGDMRKGELVMDSSITEDRVDHNEVMYSVKCGIARGRGCNASALKERGLVETGLGPVFPENAACPGIDDYYALDYTFKRRKEAYHGGIDMPVKWGTPMLAAAAGTVVAMFKGEDSARGKEIALRHSPEDTGIPLWIYTTYGHLDRLPEHKIGQRVRMGEVLGPTGNSGRSGMGGKQNTKRRPAIHYAVFYSESPKYTIFQDTVLPVDGRWMDSNAVYRQKLPVDSEAMKALPDEGKGVPIPIMFEDGTTSPAATKLVWPYACKRD